VEIDRKLYLGGRLAAQNYEWLSETFGELGYILNLSECSNYYEEEPRFNYKRINISDACESNISCYFEEASNFISEGLNNDCCVFVHCREGKSRSIAMTIAYFMIKRDWTLEKAYQHIVTVLPWKENINQGFKIQLMNLDLKKQGKDEVRLDFYNRRNRRRSQINYCEIDPNDDSEESEPKKKSKSKSKSKSRLIQPMLSFETYWKLLASEKNNPPEPEPSDPPPLTSNDPTSPISTDPTPPISEADPMIPVATKDQYTPLDTYMDLDTLENNIEAYERKQKMKRKILKNRNKQIPEDRKKDEKDTPVNQPQTPAITSPKKRVRSTKNTPKKNKNSKKARLDSTNQENNTTKPSDKKAGAVHPDDSKPLKIVNLQNLKQQTLFAYFKKL